MAAYESMVLLSLLFVKKYANQKADIFLQNGKETAQFEKQKTTLSGGFRFVIARGRPLLRGKSAAPKKKRHTNVCLFFLELLGGFEPPTSSLPKSRGCVYGVPIHAK